MAPTIKSLAQKIESLEKKFESISSRLPESVKPSRFTDNGDGTVTDKETNLTWVKQDDGKRRTWSEAKEYCEKLTLAGGGWRLPTVKELISIIDYDKHGPAIDPVFTGTQSSYYWSSTPDADDSSYAWSVYFSYGFVYWYGVGGYGFVRPVRQNSLGSSTL